MNNNTKGAGTKGVLLLIMAIAVMIVWRPETFSIRASDSSMVGLAIATGVALIVFLKVIF